MQPHTSVCAALRSPRGPLLTLCSPSRPSVLRWTNNCTCLLCNVHNYAGVCFTHHQRCSGTLFAVLGSARLSEQTGSCSVCSAGLKLSPDLGRGGAVHMEPLTMVAWRHVKSPFRGSSIAHLSVAHTSDLQTAKATQMSFIFWLAYPSRKWNRLQCFPVEIYQVMNTKCHLPSRSRSFIAYHKIQVIVQLSCQKETNV